VRSNLQSSLALGIGSAALSAVFLTSCVETAPQPPAARLEAVPVPQVPQGPNQASIPTPAFNAATVEVFDISRLDHQPVPVFMARPYYPFAMRRAGVSGEVLVDFIVDREGYVRNAFAARSSQREFELPAIQAVRQWRFRPGMVAGRAVYTHMQVPIMFSINS
jgi:protein TonB